MRGDFQKRASSLVSTSITSWPNRRPSQVEWRWWGSQNSWCRVCGLLQHKGITPRKRKRNLGQKLWSLFPPAIQILVSIQAQVNLSCFYSCSKWGATHLKKVCCFILNVKKKTASNNNFQNYFKTFRLNSSPNYTALIRTVLLKTAE